MQNVARPPRNESLVRVIEILTKDLVHRKHVDLVLLEHGSHAVVTTDLALVVGVLQIVGSNIGPYPLDGLRAGELRCSVTVGPSAC